MTTVLLFIPLGLLIVLYAVLRMIDAERNERSEGR